MFRSRMILPAFALIATLSPLAMAQDAGGNNGDRGNRGDRQRGGQNDNGGGGGNQGDRQARMANWVKEQLGATDEEMKVIQPKLEKLMLARRDSGGGFGMFGGRGGPGGRGGDSDNETLSPAQQASRDLRTTLENKSATAEEIAAKLKALREARAKARESVASAQKELKEVLTQRQEAVLVNMGFVE
jgi:hypothetical protein